MRNFDRVASIYDSTRGLPKDVMESVVNAIADELRGSEITLDAGAGTGRFSAPLTAKGLNVVGLDVSSAMLLEAKRKSLPNLVRGELTTMPFADATFDSCLMIHVLHLVENPSGLLSEIARVCRSRVLSLSETSDKERIREHYIELMGEAGYQWEAISEQKLTTIVPPTELKDVVRFTTESNSDDDIEYLEKRLSASTWDVPDEVHKKIIDRLKSTMGGKTIRQERTIKLALWDVGKIRSVKLAPH